MAKRIISLIVLFTVLISMISITEFSAVNIAGDKDYLFLDDFDKKHSVYDYPDNVHYYYDELYYHHVDENDLESKIDWAIIYATFYAGSAMSIKRLVLDRVITNGSIEMYYPVGWALYDAQTKEFISIDKVDVTKYQGLEIGLEKAHVGNPLGDADMDGELTILDATYIQRVLAKLYEFDIWDDLSYCSLAGVKYDRPLDYISDIDGDGERNILDATAIQLKLAKLDYPVATPDQV